MSEMLLNRFDESYEELSGYVEQIRDFLLVREPRYCQFYRL